MEKCGLDIKAEDFPVKMSSICKNNANTSGLGNRCICRSIVLGVLTKALCYQSSLLLTTDNRAIRIKFKCINSTCTNGLPTRRQSYSFKDMVFLQASNFSFHCLMPNRSIWTSNCFTVCVRCHGRIKVTDAREMG